MENAERRYPYVELRANGWRSWYCEKRLEPWSLFHYHKVIEIYFLVEGKCKFFIDEALYELKAGDIAIIPPNVLHKAYYEPDVPITRYIINCEAGLVLPKSWQMMISSGYYVKRLKAAFSEVEKLFRRVHKEYEQPDEISTELVQGYLTSIAALISRNPQSQENTEVKTKSHFVDEAIAYIKNNYSNNITLEEVARTVSVSHIHLSRTFKAETGFGLNEFLNIYRLRQAKFMLLEFSSKSISEIAYDCGFNDSNYFAVRFKKLFGITPTDFRSGKSTDKKLFPFS